MSEELVAWAVLDMDGDAFHSVHLFKEEAEKAAFGLGSVVPLIMPCGASNPPASTNDTCPECHGTKEVFGHADDCRDDLCALNGDMNSCSGKVEPCGCTTQPAPTNVAGAKPTIYVSRKSLDELLNSEGDHVALQTLIHRKPLRSGNGVPLYEHSSPTNVAGAEEAVHELTAGFGHKWPDNYAAQIVNAVLTASAGAQDRLSFKSADICETTKQVEAIIGDYVDLSDRRYEQMMKFVRQEISRKPEHKENSSFVLVPKTGTVVPDFPEDIAHVAQTIVEQWYDDVSKNTYHLRRDIALALLDERRKGVAS